MLAGIVFLTSCANVGDNTDGGTTTQDETVVEETTMGAVMEETMMEETALEETMVDDATVEGTTTEKTTKAEAITKGGGTVPTGEAITDLRAIITEPDKQFLVGRPVRLTGANVRGVINDQSFLLGPRCVLRGW